ncbi:MFS transporter [Nocardia niwae]|uniref:MFS transporter n=1 Tax=Nocardia niwae TaxID=626084 RepID=A0ABV2X6W3_9NOCA|nr:MFS transporter [Nocardia niwae]
MHTEPTSVEPLTERSRPVTASGDDPPPLVRGSVNSLIVWLFPANLVLFLVAGAIPGLLLPRQLELLDPGAKDSNLALVLGISAFCAMMSAPIAGQVSDRTRSRYGRRAPWLVIGAFAGTLALVGLATANSLTGIIIAWSLAQIAYNFVAGPLSAILPDRVPRRRRGVVAAVAGVALTTGSLIGSTIASLLYDDLVVGYLLFATINLVVITLFVLCNPDHSSRDLPVQQWHWADFARTFWVNPRRHPDFFWAFFARLLLFTGYFMVSGYQLYLLSDYIGLERPHEVIPVIGVIALAGVVLSNVVAGPLSDRLGRRKPFVFGASIVMGASLALPWAWPTLTAWYLMIAVLSLGFGMYGAVDTALMSEVLPSAQSYGKDLGVINIAAALPQTISPAVAGVVIGVFGYAGLFPAAIVFAGLGALAIWPIKSVR